MNIEEYRTYCISKPGVTEHFPFDETTLVFKVMNKIFAFTDVESFGGISLKCDPETAVILREKYSAVKPGYHLNKKNWNTIEMDLSISDTSLYEWIDDSYQLIVESLPKKDQQILGSLNS